MNALESMSVKDIKQHIVNIEQIDDVFLQAMLQDERKSVQLLAQKHIKLLQKKAKIYAEHQQRLAIERELYATQRVQYIAGIDEVGRGPLAGPVVTAAVILPQNCDALIGVNDSKQLSHTKRVEYAQLIRQVALDIQLHVCDVAKIDELNIYQATRYSMLQCVSQLHIRPDYLLLDAMTIDSHIPQQSIIKGDQLSLSIAAASIIAKVYRDELMDSYAAQYPEFGFEQHKGYGTSQHLEALAKYGYTPIHRQSFAPIKDMKHVYQK